MAKKLYVYSTLANDQAYHGFAKNDANDVATIERSVLIKGGAGVANDRIITPRGIRTEITEQDEAILQANKVFKLHEKNGFVLISQDDIDADQMGEMMSSDDKSRPLTEDQAKETAPEGATVVVGGKKSE